MDDETRPLLATTRFANAPHVTSTNSVMSEVPFASAPTKNQLGTLNGCFVPCCMSIMSAVMFLRLGWATGEAGWFRACLRFPALDPLWHPLLAGIIEVIGMLLVGELLTVLTALSLSAIATNGDMQGGGSYYMISRSLGPEYGGAIGLCFYLSYAFSVAYYIIAVGTTIQSTWFPQFDESPYWMTTAFSSSCLVVAMLICLSGARYFTKMNVSLFSMQSLVLLVGLISIAIPHTFNAEVVDQTYEIEVNFPHQLVNNLYSNYSQETLVPDAENPCQGPCNFQKIFAIIFPMLTGIMEGANLSGDLKNPAKSIPLGTLAAIAVSGCSYLLIIFIQGSAYERRWLVSDLLAFQHATYAGEYVVVFGILVASYSSALGAVFGGSRILQAIARDELFPFIKKFGYGSAKGDEPSYAVVCTCILAQLCVFIGNIDVLAPVITSVYCLAYALVNLTFLALSLTGVPNFRPSFHYCTWWTALLGTVLNLGVSFFLNWVYGLFGVVVVTLVFVFLVIRAPAKNWGAISHALVFHQVRKYLLMIDATQQHTKFWRPNILLLLDNPGASLIGFCNNLKKGGILVIGQVIPGNFDTYVDIAKNLRLGWINFIRDFHVKAFPHFTISSNFKEGAESLLLGAGMGGIKCNTLCLPLSTKWVHHGEYNLQHQTKPDRVEYLTTMADVLGHASSRDVVPFTGQEFYDLPAKSASEFCAILHHALRLDMNLIIACNYSAGCHAAQKTKFFSSSASRFFTSPPSPKRYTDVWIIGEFSATSEAETMYSIWDYDHSPLQIHVSESGLLPKRSANASKPTSTGLEGLLALLLQLGSISDNARLDASTGGKMKGDHSVRVMHVSTRPCTAMEAPFERASRANQLHALCELARMDISFNEITVLLPIDVMDSSATYRRFCSDGQPVPFKRVPLLERAAAFNDLILDYSADNTAQIFLTLPFPAVPTREDECEAYVRMLTILTNELPPTALTCNGEDIPFISTCI
eukprot:m.772359 g.772359  ORF g.772359 m.772359 type:complete len:983 (-) comp59097_c0_seq7:2715-5663(-)